MYRSCLLVQNFAKQGLKIRIRKESGPRPSRYTQSKRKNLKRKSIETINNNTSEEEYYEELEEEKEEEEYDDNDLIMEEAAAGGHHISAFKKVTPAPSPPPPPPPAPISNKRRLSLSYLLDHNENSNKLPPINTENNSTMKLPIINPTAAATALYHHHISEQQGKM
jgi:hypothetical protein